LAAAVVITLLFVWQRLASGIGGYRIYEVPSRSMEPTIRPGERIIVNHDYYRGRPLRRGDVIIIHRDRENLVATRLIGLPGDVVEVSDVATIVNGSVLQEPYAVHINGGRPSYAAVGPLTIPEDEIFVMGDNRDMAFDSRHPGFERAETDDVKGRASVILWSDNRERIGKNIE